VAATLLFVGGLDALQAAAICAALPFSLVLLATPIAMLRSLRNPAAADLDPPVRVPE
jgi:choline-glycine betaine transporter